MKDEELVEALARRLLEVGNELEPRDGHYTMAHECLRQMRWIRQECDRVASAHWGGPSAPECGDPNACCGEAIRANMKAEPLTLAPPEWNPNER